MNGYRLIELVWLLFFVAFFGSIVYALVGCTPNPCVKPVIQLEEPVLPTVSATDMACLKDSTWDALWQRDLILQSKLRECRAVVEELTDGP